MPLDNREPGKESCAKQGRADLADPATDALDGLSAINNQCFSIAIFQADVTQGLRHGKRCAGGNQ